MKKIKTDRKLWMRLYMRRYRKQKLYTSIVNNSLAK